jgi:osmotically inducible lipoprotein OsmB
MRKSLVGAALAGTLALSACTTPGNEDLMTGALVGAGLGSITAAVLSNNPNWIIVGALAGAAAGTLVAENRRANRCAYARGDGTYYTRGCP